MSEGGGLAFYAPMKPPDDPTPSGDRTLARALWTAFSGLGAEDDLAPRLASRFVSRDGVGDPSAQALLAHEGAVAAEQAAAAPKARAWLTYHNYYKAPDLIGPAVARAWDVPYAIVEASRSRRRLQGPWAAFAQKAEAACDAADVIFYMTDRDRPALEAARPAEQHLVRLRPFLARDALQARKPRASEGALRLATVAMMRPGDKLASYATLAAALARVETAFALEIVGDGPSRAAVQGLFEPLGSKVRFLGQLDAAGVADRLAAAELFLWPGVNEAFGLVYLEAQAEGTPVVAEDRPGVRDVARSGGVLTAPDDPADLALAIDALAQDRGRIAALGAAGRAQVDAEHTLGPARRTLRSGLLGAMARRRGTAA